MVVKHSAAYIGATCVRAAALGLWGLAVPALLTVAGYGQYSLLSTTVLLAAQLAMLGMPQVLIANARRTLPVLGLMLHAIALALAVAIIGSLALPQVGLRLFPLLAVGTIAVVVYKIGGARARADLAFPAALASESAVATVFLLAGITMLLLRQNCQGLCPSGPLAVAAEALAFGTGGLVLMTMSSLRPRAEEMTVRGTMRWLPSVYSVGFLALFDIILLRRIEVYFLQRSADGLQGVAVFSLGAQFGTMLQLLPVAMTETWQPQLAILWRAGRGGFNAAFHRLQRQYLLGTVATFLIGVPACLGVVALGFHKYAPWLGLIGIITASRILFVTTALHSSTLYALGMQRHLYRPVVLGTVVALAANAMLTLPFGLRGAVLSFVVAQMTLSWLTWRAFVRGVGQGSAGAGGQVNVLPTERPAGQEP